jgi:hypothetical protein
MPITRQSAAVPPAKEYVSNSLLWICVAAATIVMVVSQPASGTLLDASRYQGLSVKVALPLVVPFVFWWVKIPVSGPLLAFISSGSVLIGAFGLRGLATGHWLYAETDPLNWMRGAVLWTLLLVIYYLLTVFRGASEKKWKTLLGFALAVMFVCTFVAALHCEPEAACVFFSAGRCIPHTRQLEHVGFALFIAVLLTGIDWILALHHLDARQKKVCELVFYLADLPTLGAFLTLMAALATGAFQDPDGFVAGSIAFQWIVAKFVFVTIEAGWKWEPAVEQKARGAAAGQRI